MDPNLHLNYCGFEDYYVTHGLDNDNVYYIFRFDNNYGALVTRSLCNSEADISYPWKFTSIRFHNNYEGYRIVHEELITHNDAEVRKLFNAVKNFPTFITNPH